ncbi:G-D-S-L family lipolytic protein [Russula earlei]|uniref:G-D-S-L family lipolytic protein n=1 Tax=Russula earlei TaxID=71964 RepID=A0ACC0TQX0_9AGAM|nr:G-D-S-L family lipolytic protein [Russula earlei]
MVALLYVLLTAGCLKNGGITAVPAGNTPGVIDTSGKTWLALGDSYTIGQSVDSNQRFPAQAGNLLQSMGISISPIQYIATTGWTTIDLQNAITSRHPQTHNVVTLLIGVNDQYQGLDTGSYRVHFIQLLQESIQLAGSNNNHVFVLSIPDYGVTPFGGGDASISRDIDTFNAINRQVTAQYRCTYIDITGDTRVMGTDHSLIANDGLHPSAKEYAVWAGKLAPLMAIALR